MNQLERLQILTEVIGEFRTAILIDEEPENVGRMVLEVIQETGDPKLADLVLNAYLKLADRELSVHYLDEAIAIMHDRIDQLPNMGGTSSSIKH